MARKPRFDRPDAWHHVMQRGARRADVFTCEGHFLLFLETIEDTAQRFGLEIHAYSLMPNHFHLLVRTPRGNLSRCMRHLDGTFTQRLNVRSSWDGPVFRGRFRSQHVADERYLDHVFAYIHMNPLRAHLAHRLEEPCWTSLRAHLGLEPPRPWLRTDVFAARLGGASGIARFHRELRGHRARWPEPMDVETGWLAPAAVPDAAAAGPPPDRHDTSSAAEVLAPVALVAGTTVEALLQPGRGPGANPARRLAVWALVRAGFAHREVGLALGMSPCQSRQVLWQVRNGSSSEFRAWQAAWEDAHG